MKIAVAKEIDPAEPRVAASPDTVKKFKALGVEVFVEPGAGIKSGLPDSEFTAVGAIVAALLLYAIAKGAPGFDLGKGFATNGYAEHSPGHYDLLSAALTEVVMTMLFLFVIMGSTHGKAPAGFAPLAIGLTLVMIHLVSIPVTSEATPGASSVPLFATSTT